MDILLGLQWGDEGKGKVVDFLAPNYQVVARFQGGPNAGHTLLFDGVKHVLHQIPSGVFRPETLNLIGNGVVLDLAILRNEILKLAERNIDVSKNLFISKKAQLILPTHRILDAAFEQQKGINKIGSTLKGIGPTYQDKIGRIGLRMGDILATDFLEKYNALKEQHFQILNYLNFSYELESLEKNFFEAIDFIKNYKIVDSEYFIAQQIALGKTILAEGAQGTLLDIDFGSYPFVTSSNTSVAGACTGLGVPPKHIGKVLGIFKAYCTRVGSGPFPTELNDEIGKKIAQLGNEFGATTGRPRRCGWLDLPSLRYANMINGTSEMLMMKTDILNTFEEIKVCTHYQLPDGSLSQEVPYEVVTTKLTPIYKTFKGWQKDLSQIRSFDQLPKEFLDYVAFIEEQTQTPISMISYGADRTETLMR